MTGTLFAANGQKHTICSENLVRNLFWQIGECTANFHAIFDGWGLGTCHKAAKLHVHTESQRSGQVHHLDLQRKTY